MDHSECQKRIDHLEDELDYNFGRKEELKKEVRKLNDKYDSLHEVHLANAKVAMDGNVENAELKAIIDKLKQENGELCLKKEEFKDNIRSLSQEITDIKKGNRKLDEVQSENRKLKATINYLKDEKLKYVSDLETVIQSLESQVGILLTCEE